MICNVRIWTQLQQREVKVVVLIGWKWKTAQSTVSSQQEGQRLEDGWIDGWMDGRTQTLTIDNLSSSLVEGWHQQPKTVLICKKTLGILLRTFLRFLIFGGTTSVDFRFDKPIDEPLLLSPVDFLSFGESCSTFADDFWSPWSQDSLFLPPDESFCSSSDSLCSSFSDGWYFSHYSLLSFMSLFIWVSALSTALQLTLIRSSE